MSKKINLTPSLEDYLEAVWILSNKKKVVRVKDIQKFMDVKSSSVIGALKSLSDKDLIDHERYGYVDLTEKGIKKSKEIYEKHKILSKFFQEILNLDEDTALNDACKIEHYIDIITLSRINKFIEFIENHPAGKPDWLNEFHDSLVDGN